jgi:hypothetical protein
MLTPFLIFNAQLRRRITSYEFATRPAIGKYACQSKAWIDEVVLTEWINIVLKLCNYACDVNNPSIQPPIILLDAYHMHQMG